MDLKKILDPNTRYIFLTTNEINHAFPVVHVKDNLIFFSNEKEITEDYQSGHFLAQGDEGIVLFTNPVVIPLKDVTKEEYGAFLYVINFDNTDYSITNRRLSARYEFKEFLPVSFQVYGDMMTAQLINISAGGLRLRVNTCLHRNVFCHFKITLPIQGKNVCFETDGIVVYSEPEKSHNNFLTGISFVAPDFANKSEHQRYVE